MPESKWWQESVVYQIYPQSFNDSNNDGIGDLNGIIEKLDYLHELGVDVLWLNPIYVSPLVDNGYDIENYYDINPIYGTKDDLKNLLKEAHDRGMRIILDLVANHTSHLHPWFQESKKSKDNTYSDFYIWKDPCSDGGTPNNWGSSFGGPAWEYVESREQYYLHCFAKEQPDLNWENPKVRQCIYNMMKYWFEFGIDGFRMDVISLISKDQTYPNGLPDAPYTKNYYIGVSNGPRVHEFLHEMNQEVLSQYDALTVGETANTTVEQALLYTDPERQELDMVFQFDHMHLDYGKYGKFSTVRFKLSDLKESLSKWEYGLEKGWNSLYFCNHDQPRSVTRFGNETEEYRQVSAKMLGTVLHMMKGTPYIFQGEELGMKNVPFDTLSDYKDIETLNEIRTLRDMGESETYIKRVCYLKSRDNARTPMPWNADIKSGYGFSTREPWISYSPDNAKINVKQALADKDSVFYHYKSLINLRHKYDVVKYGDFQLISENDSDIFAYTRTEKDKVLVVICSFSKNRVMYKLPFLYHNLEGDLLLSNYKSSSKKLKSNYILEPYEALVYLVKDN